MHNVPVIGIILNQKNPVAFAHKAIVWALKIQHIPYRTARQQKDITPPDSGKTLGIPAPTGRR
jgi:hypothetical protein